MIPDVVHIQSPTRSDFSLESKCPVLDVWGPNLGVDCAEIAVARKRQRRFRKRQREAAWNGVKCRKRGTDGIERNGSGGKLSRIQRDCLIREGASRHILPWNPPFIVMVHREAAANHEAVSSRKFLEPSIAEIRIPGETHVRSWLLEVPAIARRA